MRELTREQEDRISRMADVFSTVRVSPPDEAGVVVATGGRWFGEDVFVPDAEPVRINPEGVTL